MASTSTLPDGINTRIRERLVEKVGQRKYDLWFVQSVRLDYRDQEQTLHVAVPNRFIADKIRGDFSQDLCDAAQAEVGNDASGSFQLDLSIEPDRFGRSPATDQASSPQAPEARRGDERRGPAGPSGQPRRRSNPAMRDTALAGRLRHRLEDYVVGPSNELAYAASLNLAGADLATTDHATPIDTGPLFIHGGCGLGKTHLLQGVCRRVLDRNPNARVLYTTGEQFANRFITAVRENTLESFRKTMRSLDLLAVDDIQFLANKNKTQQEFLHCFDHIELGGSRVVLASDNHPKLIKQFSEALVSRCVRGLVVQVQPPDTPTRIALVQRLAQRRGLLLQGRVDELVATHAGRSVREIEGCVAHLHALASLDQPQATSRIVSRSLAERLFAQEAQSRPQRPVRFGDVQTAVCSAMNVSAQQIAGSSRHRQVVLARALTIHLTRQMTTMSFPEIAAALGKSSHSTVVTASQRILGQLKENLPLMLPSRPEPVTPGQLVEELRRDILDSL